MEPTYKISLLHITTPMSRKNLLESKITKSGQNRRILSQSSHDVHFQDCSVFFTFSKPATKCLGKKKIKINLHFRCAPISTIFSILNCCCPIHIFYLLSSEIKSHFGQHAQYTVLKPAIWVMRCTKGLYLVATTRRHNIWLHKLETAYQHLNHKKWYLRFLMTILSYIICGMLRQR